MGSKGRRMSDDNSFAYVILHLFGDLFYFVGLETEYAFVRMGRGVRKGIITLKDSVSWTASFMNRTCRPFFAAVWEDLHAPWRQMRNGLHNAFHIMREERAAGGSAAGKGTAYFLRGIVQNRTLISHGLSYLLPAGALAVFLITTSSVLSSTFALRVDYRGEFVGFIENESVYDAAHNDIMDRIQNAGTKDDWKVHPEFTITIVDRAALYSEKELTDKIIETSSAEFLEATGVYVNDELIGVTNESEALSHEIESLKAPLQQQYGEEDGWRVEFQQDVQLKPGLYFTSTVVSLDCLMARLHGQLPVMLSDGNSLEGWDMLGVQAVHSVSRIVSTQAEPEIFYDPQLRWGKEVIEQEAADGQTEFFEDVIYIDGVEVQRIQTSEPNVIVPAVPQITRYGTYNPYGGNAGDPATGTFAWPVPEYRGISRWAGAGWPAHRGVDITGPIGTVIVAADNGVVEMSLDAEGMGGGLWTYGKFVKIDHGNDFSTLYAHCSELLVNKGDYVVKGQPIAKIGMTGNTSGPHLHFEIQLNNKWINPRPYLTVPK